MALNKSSKPIFGATENLDFGSNTQEEQKVHDVHEVHKEIGTTQGKKGQKLKRINMAFSDINHEYITKESRRRGISGTAFVNLIIDEYRKK
jgi:predicted DNA binding CopG/RHH family protein